MSGSTRERGTPRVKVLEKAFRILEVLQNGPEGGVRLADVVASVQIPKQSVFRILQTLEALEYVTAGRTAHYQIATRLKDLGHPQNASVLMRLARPSMTRLLAEFEQTVNLSLVENERLVYKGAMEGLRAMRMQVAPGTVLSWPRTALGKSILAYLKRDRVISLIKSSGDIDREFLSVGRKRKLFRDLAGVQQAGYALDQEESEPGLCCIGAPIFNSAGQPFAAISVSGSVGSLPPKAMRQAAKRVKEECARISRSLGYLDCPRPVG